MHTMLYLPDLGLTSVGVASACMRGKGRDGPLRRMVDGQTGGGTGKCLRGHYLQNIHGK